MNIIVLIFSPCFILFLPLSSCYARTTASERSARSSRLNGPQLIQSPTGVHCSSVFAGYPGNRHFPARVSAIRQMKITPGFFRVCIFVGLFFASQEGGKG